MTGQSWFAARRLAAHRRHRRLHLRAHPDPVRRVGGLQPARDAELDGAHPEPVRAGELHRTCSTNTDSRAGSSTRSSSPGCRRSSSLALATFAAYAFSRFRFSGRRPGLLFLLIVQMFPAFLAIVVDLPHVHADHRPLPGDRLQHPVEPDPALPGRRAGRQHVAHQGLLRHGAQGARRVGQGRRRLAHDDVPARSSCRSSRRSSSSSGCWRSSARSTSSSSPACS